MKKGEYESYLSACPFYKREENMRVCCCGWGEGVEEIAVRFRTVREAKAHKEAYCRSLSGYKKCPVYAMIEGEIEEG